MRCARSLECRVSVLGSRVQGVVGFEVKCRVWDLACRIVGFRILGARGFKGLDFDFASPSHRSSLQ